MFDLAWSEILLIAVIALLVIGPKQLPETLKGIARGIGKAKETFRQFQAQADDLVKEANLQEVRDQIQDVKNTINEIRSFDIKSTIEKTVDADGTLKSAFTEPGTYTPPAWTPPATAATTEGAPDFIPPSTLAPYVPPPPPPPPPTAASVDSAPSFLPPSTMAPPAPVPEPAPVPVAPVPVAPVPVAPVPVAPANPPAAEAPAPRPATTQA